MRFNRSFGLLWFRLENFPSGVREILGSFSPSFFSPPPLFPFSFSFPVGQLPPSLSLFPQPSLLLPFLFPRRPGSPPPSSWAMPRTACLPRHRLRPRRRRHRQPPRARRRRRRDPRRLAELHRPLPAPSTPRHRHLPRALRAEGIKPPASPFLHRLAAQPSGSRRWPANPRSWVRVPLAAACVARGIFATATCRPLRLLTAGSRMSAGPASSLSSLWTPQPLVPPVIEMG